MSPRRLAGWEPAEITTHEYDDQGRLVRSVTVREPEWSPDDVAALLASRREQFAPRGSHGILISESTDPALKDAWEVDLPTRDFVTAKLHEVQDTYFKQYPSAKGDSSLIWRARKRQE